MPIKSYSLSEKTVEKIFQFIKGRGTKFQRLFVFEIPSSFVYFLSLEEQIVFYAIGWKSTIGLKN